MREVREVFFPEAEPVKNSQRKRLVGLLATFYNRGKWQSWMLLYRPYINMGHGILIPPYPMSYLLPV
jgi:hypothetical protein